MALRDLLVHVDQTEHALARLHLAADLARRHGSRLTAIYVRELNAAQLHDERVAELGLGSPAAISRTTERIEKSMHDAADRLRSALAALGHDDALEVEWRNLDGIASILVPQHARFADLCIIGQGVPFTPAAIGYTFSEQLLFVTGRPVVIIPRGRSFDTLGRRILVAWNSSRASARAVNDALPLIERAEQVTVVAINSGQFVERYSSLPPRCIVEHLARHNPAVQGVHLDDVPAHSITDALQNEARRRGADLIVAGAFGHPKLWEKLVGGVTQELLTRADFPLLMSY